MMLRDSQSQIRIQGRRPPVDYPGDCECESCTLRRQAVRWDALLRPDCQSIAGIGRKVKGLPDWICVVKLIKAS